MAEFYATMETQFILSSQIFANLEHDVQRAEAPVSAEIAAAGSLMTSRVPAASTSRGRGLAAATASSSPTRHTDPSPASPSLDGSVLFAQTLRIDTARVLMTARGGRGSAEANAAAAAELFGAALPADFRLAVPPGKQSQNTAGDEAAAAAAEVSALREALRAAEERAARATKK